MNPLDYSRFRTVTARQIIRALTRDGFVRDRHHGAHQQYRHPDGRQVTVSYHRSSETFPLKTLRSMIEVQARWTEDDLTRLGLVK